MITPSRLLNRVVDIEAGIEVAGFVTPSDAFEWAARENKILGRVVYEVRSVG